MVFGNKGDDSGTGVAFTRDPATGENRALRRLPRATRRARTSWPASAITEPLDAMGNDFPECHAAAARGDADRSQNHYRDMCDIEFTIEQGRLFMLQTRVGKRTAAAALRMAVEMEDEGLIDKREAVLPGRSPRSSTSCCTRSSTPTATYHALDQGPERVAGRGGRQGVLHRRRRRGAPRAGAST